jgi:hypothetical protein
MPTPYKRIALPVAGDDAAAKAVVLKLVDDLGFDPVDVGGLDESWRQQPGSPVYTKDYDAAGVRKALAAVHKERTPDWRATPDSPGSLTRRRNRGRPPDTVPCRHQTARQLMLTILGGSRS